MKTFLLFFQLSAQMHLKNEKIYYVVRGAKSFIIFPLRLIEACSYVIPGTLTCLPAGFGLNLPYNKVTNFFFFWTLFAATLPLVVRD